MAFNNAFPSWVFLLGSAQEKLTDEAFIDWLLSEDAQAIPPHVRDRHRRLSEMRVKACIE